MLAIEFRAKIKNGIIEIPEEYRKELHENVKVILLTEKNKISTNKVDQLLESPLKVENFIPITREEIYEQK